MEPVTLDEIIEVLKENIENESSNEGLASWSINASGQNFAEQLANFSLDDLRTLRDEIVEGIRVEVTIDLSEAVLAFVEDSIDQRETEESNDFLDEDEEGLLDEDDSDSDDE